jgi:hypothetical protein
VTKKEFNELPIGSRVKHRDRAVCKQVVGELLDYEPPHTERITGPDRGGRKLLVGSLVRSWDRGLELEVVFQSQAKYWMQIF